MEQKHRRPVATDGDEIEVGHFEARLQLDEDRELHPRGQTPEKRCGHSGVVIDDKIWYVESNTRPNNLVRFDPKTEKFQTWQIPNGGGIVRHMMPTADGKIAMAMSGNNTVGIVEILPSSSN